MIKNKRLKEAIENVGMVNNIDGQNFEKDFVGTAPVSYADAVLRARKRKEACKKAYEDQVKVAKEALKKEVSNEEHPEPLGKIRGNKEGKMTLDEGLFESFEDEHLGKVELKEWMPSHAVWVKKDGKWKPYSALDFDTLTDEEVAAFKGLGYDDVKLLPNDGSEPDKVVESVVCPKCGKDPCECNIEESLYPEYVSYQGKKMRVQGVRPDGKYALSEPKYSGLDVTNHPEYLVDVSKEEVEQLKEAAEDVNKINSEVEKLIFNDINAQLETLRPSYGYGGYYAGLKSDTGWSSDRDYWSLEDNLDYHRKYGSAKQNLILHYNGYRSVEKERLKAIAQAIKNIGGKYIATRYGSIYFYLDLARYIEKDRQAKQQAEERRREKLMSIDIEKYRPSDALISKARQYYMTNSTRFVRKIDNIDTYLTYYYLAKLLDWSELYDVVRSKAYSVDAYKYSDVEDAIDLKVKPEKIDRGNSGFVSNFRDVVKFCIDNQIQWKATSRRATPLEYEKDTHNGAIYTIAYDFEVDGNMLPVAVHTDEGGGRPYGYMVDGAEVSGARQAAALIIRWIKNVTNMEDGESIHTEMKEGVEEKKVYKVTYKHSPQIFSSVMVKAANEDEAKQKVAAKKPGKDIVGVSVMSDYEVKDMTNRGMSLMEARVIDDFSSYEPWDAAVNTFDNIQNAGKMDALEQLIDEMYPDGVDRAELNDLLAFESEWVYSMLNMSSEEEDGPAVDFDEEE